MLCYEWVARQASLNHLCTLSDISDCTVLPITCPSPRCVFVGRPGDSLLSITSGLSDDPLVCSGEYGEVEGTVVVLEKGRMSR